MVNLHMYILYGITNYQWGLAVHGFMDGNHVEMVVINHCGDCSPIKSFIMWIFDNGPMMQEILMLVKSVKSMII